MSSEDEDFTPEEEKEEEESSEEEEEEDDEEEEEEEEEEDEEDEEEDDDEEEEEEDDDEEEEEEDDDEEEEEEEEEEDDEEEEEEEESSELEPEPEPEPEQPKPKPKTKAKPKAKPKGVPVAKSAAAKHPAPRAKASVSRQASGPGKVDLFKHENPEDRFLMTGHFNDGVAFSIRGFFMAPNVRKIEPTEARVLRDHDDDFNAYVLLCDFENALLQDEQVPSKAVSRIKRNIRALGVQDVIVEAKVFNTKLGYYLALPFHSAMHWARQEMLAPKKSKLSPDQRERLHSRLMQLYQTVMDRKTVHYVSVTEEGFRCAPPLVASDRVSEMRSAAASAAAAVSAPASASASASASAAPVVVVNASRKRAADTHADDVAADAKRARADNDGCCCDAKRRLESISFIATSLS